MPQGTDGITTAKTLRDVLALAILKHDPSHANNTELWKHDSATNKRIATEGPTETAFAAMKGHS